MFVKLSNTMQKIVREVYEGQLECSGHLKEDEVTVSLGGLGRGEI